MDSGSWKIIVAGDQIATQRAITLRVGQPQITWITVTPTVVVGYTTTAQATSIQLHFISHKVANSRHQVANSSCACTAVQRTVSQTQTLILVPQTITAACNGGIRTVTVYPTGPTVTVGSTVVRTVTDGQRTSIWTTTVSATAVCHFPSSGSSSTCYQPGSC